MDPTVHTPDTMLATQSHVHTETGDSGAQTDMMRGATLTDINIKAVRFPVVRLARSARSYKVCL
ncbi:Protein of unknown function [Pyronema omphalodes CBS 100304]|uniref:Uncharacterized protein n=1 Tax=Pyronema omphalodes (strain CBS 100304) TaxID=1076935 RepID=U4LRF1_PYROM|nr:Protein of unknown function [Pyronema omphalodes CBS 100304]